MAAVFDVDSLIMNNVCAYTVISQLCLALLDCNCILNICTLQDLPMMIEIYQSLFNNNLVSDWMIDAPLERKWASSSCVARPWTFNWSCHPQVGAHPTLFHSTKFVTKPKGNKQYNCIIDVALLPCCLANGMWMVWTIAKKYPCIFISNHFPYIAQCSRC